MPNRPVTTLFLIMSLDGKISSGDRDDLDVDKDWKTIPGVKEGLSQYYDLEKQTDACFLQTGRTFAKIGINEREPAAVRISVTGVIVDNKPHLDQRGLTYLSSWLECVIIATKCPTYRIPETFRNVHAIRYRDTIDFADLFSRLKTDFGIERITIQSGGMLNGTLLRAGLIDHVSIVVAPLLVGGASTPTLIDGDSIRSVDQLGQLAPLRLTSCSILKDSYLHLRYDVIHPETE